MGVSPHIASAVHAVESEEKGRATASVGKQTVKVRQAATLSKIRGLPLLSVVRVADDGFHSNAANQGAIRYD